MNGPVVIKVGGSLFNWSEFPKCLIAYLAGRLPAHCVLLGGGGPAADIVREWDRIHGLGDVLAHQLAVRSMDLTAHGLAGLLPGSRVVETVEDTRKAWEQGSVPILAPRRFLDEIDAQTANPLPASWDVTSDSIAARVASFLEASEFVLLKSASLPPGVDRHGAAGLGLVDPFLPATVRGIPRVSYVNLREQPPVSISI